MKLRGCWADLTGADLRNHNFSKADLSGANLNESDITGVILHQTVRDGWKIRDITCDYVYLDENRKKRDPEEGNFRPGEFEKLYR